MIPRWVGRRTGRILGGQENSPRRLAFVGTAQTVFADYARDGESAKELRARVNRTILEDLEAKMLALRALHAKLRELDAGESFGDIVARGRPKGVMQ